jgi:hypothetical protein
LWPKSPRAAVVRMRATTTNIDIVRDRHRYVGAGWQSWATDKRSLIMRWPAVTANYRAHALCLMGAPAIN